MLRKYLFVGPLLPPVHGQSLAFTRFYESMDTESVVLINTNMEHLGKITKYFMTLKIFCSIIYAIIKYDICLVYFTCSRSFLGSIKDVLLINLAKKNIPIVNHLHGSDFYEFLHDSPLWYKKILYKSYNRVNTSIVLLENMKGQFKDFPRMNLRVVPNFYDNELNKAIVNKGTSIIKILYLSNIMTSKGIFDLLEAFSALISMYGNIELDIAGGFLADEYHTKEEVKKIFFKMIKQNDKNDKIKYHGKVYGEVKVKLLQQSDIFVLPTYYRSEAFPISIIEAMACGNAIVSTKYKYIPEIVKESSGLLIEVKSKKSIQNALATLIDDKDKMGAIQLYNTRYAKDNFSLEKYIFSLKNILKEVDGSQ